VSQAPLRGGIFYAILATSQTKTMLYDIEVRPTSKTGHFNYYTETIEAATSHDAVKRVKRANPGCDVRCCKSYNASGSGGGSIDLGDSGGYLALGMIVLGLWLIVEFWWIVIPVAVLGGIGWFLKD